VELLITLELRVVGWSVFGVDEMKDKLVGKEISFSFLLNVSATGIVLWAAFEGVDANNLPTGNSEPVFNGGLKSKEYACLVAAINPSSATNMCQFCRARNMLPECCVNSELAKASAECRHFTKELRESSF